MTRIACGASAGLSLALMLGTAMPLTAAEVAKDALSRTMPWGEFKLSPRIADKIRANQKMNIVVDIEGTGLPI